MIIFNKSHENTGILNGPQFFRYGGSIRSRCGYIAGQLFYGGTEIPARPVSLLVQKPDNTAKLPYRP